MYMRMRLAFDVLRGPFPCIYKHPLTCTSNRLRLQTPPRIYKTVSAYTNTPLHIQVHPAFPNTYPLRVQAHTCIYKHHSAYSSTPCIYKHAPAHISRPPHTQSPACVYKHRPAYTSTPLHIQATPCTYKHTLLYASHFLYTQAIPHIYKGALHTQRLPAYTLPAYTSPLHVQGPPCIYKRSGRPPDPFPEHKCIIPTLASHSRTRLYMYFSRGVLVYAG